MIDFENDRRFRHVVFSRGVEIPGWAVVQIVQTLPADAILFHVDFDFQRNQNALCFWSSVFEHVPIGREAPCVTGWIDTEAMRAGLNELLP